MSSWAKWLPALISAGAGVAGNVIGSRATGKATDRTVAASEKAAELERLTAKEALEYQKDAYNKALMMQFPFLQQGTQALTPYGRGMGLPVPEGGYQVPTLKSLMLSTGPGTAEGAPGTGTGEGGPPSLGTLPPSSTVKPGSTPGSVVGGALKGAGTGAMIGSIVPGVGTAIGAGTGALIGGFSGLVGRGRKEANQIVPYQEALTAEFDGAIKRIKSKGEALTPADWQAEIDRLEPLYNEYQGLAQKFGRAGPGAQQSTAYMGDMLNEWKGYAGIPGRAHGGPVRGKRMMGDGDYIVGENGPEILDMAPGSEGYVYPHSSFTAMMRGKGRPMLMPGRAEGGGVEDIDPNAPPPVPGDMGVKPFTMEFNKPQEPPPSDPNNPYPIKPGEFLQPFPGGLPDYTKPNSPLPEDVNLRPFSMEVNKRPFSFNADDVFKDPSYGFRLSEGVKARERLASAGGRTLGGRTLKELTRYGQDYASTEYGKAYDRARGENELAYGRDVDEYGRKRGENELAYGRDVGQYDRQMGRSNTTYDRSRQDQQDAERQWAIKYGVWNDDNERRYQRSKTATGIV